MTLVVILIAIVAAAAFLAVWMKGQIAHAISSAHTQLLSVTQQQLAAQRAGDVQELEVRKQAVEHAVAGLMQQLAKAEQLIRDLEKDRIAKFSSLAQQLEEQARQTQKLGRTAEQLTSVLGNAKVRGQWGEKIAEDILRLCGLQENLHYRKQQTSQAGRPDITFLLPGDHVCYMDVKCPLDNYLKYVNTNRPEDQEQFLRDVRVHLKELERRDYAPAGGGSPDYVLMFIPNEQVYGAVNEWMPGLIDEALAKRLIVCGPWMLYAQVRLIWQGWQAYYHERAIGDIARTVSEFLKAYDGFQKRFEELGAKLDAATQKYQEIARISYAQLGRKIEQIEAYRRGQGQEGASSSSSLKEEPSDLLMLKEVVP